MDTVGLSYSPGHRPKAPEALAQASTRDEKRVQLSNLDFSWSAVRVIGERE